MSALKYQLRELISSLSAEANKMRDPEVKRRLYLVKAVAESKKDVKKTCESRGISTDSFYDWSRRLLKEKNLLALVPGSKSPKTFWNKTPKRIEKRIIKIRNAEPFKGPERISFDLKKVFNMICPPSTVAAVLKRAGLVTKEYRDRLTKKHIRRYRRPLPGYMQMDIKFVPYLIEGRQHYQLSAIDHHSSWRLIRSYPDHTVDTVLKFLNELETEVPFSILQIQTDNATEFTDKFSSQGGSHPTTFHLVDLWCKQREIEHKLIPVGEKELNGKVENSHKWDDREFFSQKTAQNLTQLQQFTQEYNHRWNTERPTKTLAWKTPVEVVEEAYVRAMAFMLYLKKRLNLKPLKMEKVFTEAGYTIQPKGFKVQTSDPPKKKPKKLSAVDRYLQYLEWEEKQKLRSFLPVPVILQNFSAYLAPTPQDFRWGQSRTEPGW